MRGAIVAALSAVLIGAPFLWGGSGPWAKLPPLTDAQKEAAAAAKAKAADAAKKDAELLNKYIDMTAEKYEKSKKAQMQAKAGMAAPAPAAKPAAAKK